MQSSSLAACAVLLVLVLAAPVVLGRPPHRQKRVSDQRLGELEALLALKKLRGKLVTVPVAFGQINPNEYGRRRRSASHSSLQGQLLLERLLESLPQDDALAALGVPSTDVYDDIPVEGGDISSQHWTTYERERPAPAFNRPVTE